MLYRSSRLVIALIILVVFAGIVNDRSQAAPEPPPAMPPRAAEFYRESDLRLPAGITPPYVSNTLSMIPDTNLIPGSQIVFQALLDSSWEIFRSESDGLWTQVTDDSDSQIMARLNRGCTKITLAGMPNKSFDIFTMNPDGSAYAQLTYGKSDNIYPAWSSDGSLIAFQTYRNNDQADIYLMYADGSNQIPLVNNPNYYEGQPTWSPDGSQIAFTADYSGLYRIYVVNWDGSGLRELVATHDSAMPIWSPDGNQIAYMADGDNNYWYEIWAVNVDGTDPHQVYTPRTSKIDAWLGSWSPDSKGLIFSEIYWVQYYGDYYWYYAEILYRDERGAVNQLADLGVDWRPDWQGCDTQPPVSAVSPLPSEAPNSFLVSWTGYDNGDAGVESYDIQVFDDAVGLWKDWLIDTTKLSADYWGVAGHTYYFRSRATDAVSNQEAWPEYADAYTRVETYPPTSAVQRLPTLAFKTIQVRWGGSDPGNSGIAYYDVQYRDAQSDTWSDWIIQSTNQSALFTGVGGNMYYFRTRATDMAGNQETWPSGDGDSSTRLYSMRMKGKLYDNSGAPVSEATITPYYRLFLGGVSDRNGNYAAYFAEESDEPYTISWSKKGYGSLPETDYDQVGDVSENFVLPPLENFVQKWDFEAGELSPEWITSGDIPALIGENNQHTGDHSLELGPVQPERGMQVLNTNILNSSQPQIVSDQYGGLHIIWQGVDGVYYSHRAMDGSWSSSGNIAPSQHVGILLLKKTRDDSLHVIWDDGDGNIYYMQHPLNGDWSGVEKLPKISGVAVLPSMEVQPNGVVHVLFQEQTSAGCDVLYTQRNDSGTWSSPQFVTQGIAGCGDAFKIKVDNQGILHVIHNSKYYLERSAQGVWSQVTQFCEYYCSSGDISVDQNSVTHISWLDKSQGDPWFCYATLQVGGNFICHQIVTEFEIDEPLMAVTLNGAAYFTWCQYGKSQMQSIYKDHSGVWSEVQPIPGFYCDYADLQLTQLWLDENESLNIAGGDTNNLQHNYIEKSGFWAEPTIESFFGNFYYMDVTQDSNHVIHYVVKQEGDVKDIFYYGTAVEEQTGIAIVSQELTIPVSMTAPTLSFMYDLWGQKTTEGSHFEAMVEDSESSTTLFSTTEGTDGWTQGSYDLTAWAGETISLTFLADRTAGVFGLTAFLDEVSIGPAYPDIWVDATGDTHARPGDQLTLEVSYGNHGGQLASGTVLSYTLPAGMSFVDASVPPVQSGNILTWELGDLEARSNSNTIVITLAIDAGAMPGEYQTSLLEINAYTDELEIANNTLEVRTYVGNMMMIPALWK